jgi:hypothetical protein
MAGVQALGRLPMLLANCAPHIAAKTSWRNGAHADPGAWSSAIRYSGIRTAHRPQAPAWRWRGGPEPAE